MIGIRDIGVYLPEAIRTNDELISRLGFRQDFLENRVGVIQRHLASADEASSDLAVKSADNVFERNPTLKPDDIDLLIVCTQNPDFKLPHAAEQGQQPFGFR